jgi:uncharacterized DUF497 family protein
MTFQWDDDKNAANIRKHGLAFEDALHVFADPMAVTRTDHFQGEERWQIIGQVFGVQVIMVVYTMRQPDGETAIRIISARKATPQERRTYESSTWFS